VTWTASSSSYSTGYPPYTAFDRNINTLWNTGNSSNAVSQPYSTTSPFAYIGTGAGNYQVTTNYSTTIQNGVGAISGEWLQIQSSVPVVLNSFSFSPNNNSYTSSCTPGSFYICGSNDGSTWYPIIRGVFGSVPYLVGSTISIVPSPVYNVSIASQSALTITNSFSSVSNINNSYSYFRLVVTNAMGTLGGGTIYTANNSTSVAIQFAEWTPYFATIATQTGPSKSLIYMDSSNISQVDVSGSLGLINSSPTSITVTPNTTAATSYTWTNNNVSWLASASSSASGGYDPYKVFNNTNATASDSWAATPNLYTSGSATSSAALTPVSGQTSQRGEWVQIQSSIPVVMNSYTFASADVPARLPKTFWIVGSNDGTTWYQIQTASCGATQYSSTAYTTSSSFLVNSASAQTSGSATVTTTINAPYTTTAFTYFRLIVLSIFSTTDTYSAIGEWKPIFTPVTSSVSLALDNTTPNQLNIGGSLGITGGITPLYSTPSFGPGQVGYVYENNTFSTGTGTNWSVLVSQAVPAGIYVATGAYGLVDLMSGYTYIGLGTITGGGEYQNSTNSGYVALSISGIFTGPCTIYLNYFNGANSKTLDTTRSRFRVVRIA
jgi:hypothetical protein